MPAVNYGEGGGLPYTAKLAIKFLENLKFYFGIILQQNLEA